MKHYNIVGRFLM